MKARDLERLIADLRRCGHGHLPGDPCPPCPGGRSVGNRLLQPGRHIGHTRYGDLVAAPSLDDWDDPSKWVRKR